MVHHPHLPLHVRAHQLQQVEVHHMLMQLRLTALTVCETTIRRRHHKVESGYFRPICRFSVQEASTSISVLSLSLPVSIRPVPIGCVHSYNGYAFLHFPACVVFPALSLRAAQLSYYLYALYCSSNVALAISMYV